MSLVCLSSANCLRAFLCIIFRRGFLLGRQPCRPILCSVRRMVWALTNWPPTPSTSAAMLAALIRLFPNTTSGYDAEHMHSLCRFVTLWSTMARPVLSGTCPVKPLYGLGHRAAAQFQGAMLNFQWPVWESESDNTKFNTPAPHSHLRPCNTNESHDTGERKWLIGPNLDIFT